VNRLEWQQFAERWLVDAQALLDSHRWEAAHFLTAPVRQCDSPRLQTKTSFRRELLRERTAVLAEAAAKRIRSNNSPGEVHFPFVV
jgi:hypothetical protein